MVETKYICEICRSKHDTHADAQECESRGRPDPVRVGLVFGKGDYKDTVFAVASWIDEDHEIYAKCWAARDTRAGDNLPPEPGSKRRDERCAIACYAGERIGGPPDTKLSAYGRMIAALRAAGIEPVDQTKAPATAVPDEKQGT